MAQPLFNAGRRGGFCGLSPARFRVRAPQLILLAAIVVVALRLTVNPTPIDRGGNPAIVQGGVGGSDGLEDSYEPALTTTTAKTTRSGVGGGGAGDGDGDADADAVTDAGGGGGGLELGDGDGDLDADGDNGVDDAAAASSTTSASTSAKSSVGKFSIKDALTRRRLDRFGRLTYGYSDGDAGKPEDGAVVMAQNNVKMPDGVVSYQNELGNNAHFRLDPPLYERLPSRDWGLFGVPHASCALVGNSGSVLGTKWGAEIDGHDAVMRVNYAPIDKWGADVGSKTTYDFSNRENARRLAQSRVALRDSKIIFFEVSSPTNRKRIFEPLVTKYKDADVHFVHPSFVERARVLWSAVKRELEVQRRTKFHDKPMSGWFSVLFMLQTCQSLDVYGFEPYTNKKTAKYPYHYFDGVQGVTSVHSFDLAIYAYLMLQEAYPLRIRTRKGWLTKEDMLKSL